MTGDPIEVCQHWQDMVYFAEEKYAQAARFDHILARHRFGALVKPHLDLHLLPDVRAIVFTDEVSNCEVSIFLDHDESARADVRCSGKFGGVRKGE